MLGRTELRLDYIECPDRGKEVEAIMSGKIPERDYDTIDHSKLSETQNTKLKEIIGQFVLYESRMDSSPETPVARLDATETALILQEPSGDLLKIYDSAWRSAIDNALPVSQPRHKSEQ